MTEQMGRVICDITISADGYSAGLNQPEGGGPVTGCRICRDQAKQETCRCDREKSRVAGVMANMLG
jgi:hypothetical protein